MGCVHAVPCARHGPRYGIEELESRLVRIHWRCNRVYHGHADDLVHERVGLSHPRGWQTDVQPLLSLPAVIRVDDFVGSFRFTGWDAVLEPVAAPASSSAEKQTVLSGDARPVLHRH